MADLPSSSDSVGNQHSIQIPKPTIEETQEIQAGDAASLVDAYREQAGFSSGKEDDLNQKSRDWRQRYLLKWVICFFVVGINIWWPWTVLRMIWSSGTSGSTFHLDDSVLIALISTSVANFLGLLVIVVRHLFPQESK